MNRWLIGLLCVGFGFSVAACPCEQKAKQQALQQQISKAEAAYASDATPEHLATLTDLHAQLKALEVATSNSEAHD